MTMKMRMIMMMWKLGNRMNAQEKRQAERAPQPPAQVTKIPRTIFRTRKKTTTLYKGFKKSILRKIYIRYIADLWVTGSSIYSEKSSKYTKLLSSSGKFNSCRWKYFLENEQQRFERKILMELSCQQLKVNGKLFGKI